jgi:hypothetical protein
MKRCTAGTVIVLIAAALSVPAAATAAPRPVPAPAGDLGLGPGVEPPSAGAAPDTLLAAGTRVRAAREPIAKTGKPRTFKVYATREGLVGHTTANGHIVTAADHFVSLPSARALSSKGGNAYSVRVCAVANHRCVYEPVWDVGPWNTRDEYWAKNRGGWPDLPRGTPQAQAAYDDGYHGGRDQFGRTVQNPAGIDLADGAIRDGLRYNSSAWVKVTYLWTGGGARGRVRTGGGTLHVRSGPTTRAPIVGLAGPYALLPLHCARPGQKITGATTSKTWYRIGKQNYVAAAYVSTRTPIQPCG